MFNGGDEYKIKHGIETIVENSAPEFLKDLQDKRVSIQFRQFGKNNFWKKKRPWKRKRRF